MSVGATATVPLHAPEPPRACVSHAEVRPAGYIGADTPRPEEARILDQPNAVPAWIAPRGCGCGTRWSVFSTPTIRFPLIAAMRSPAHACASAEGEGSHLLSFLPLGVGNPIKSPHSWQGERRHARSGSAWFENSRQKPSRSKKLREVTCTGSARDV